ncbi:MAG: ester cyclase [Ardenticatenaceae bacterium]|nr:ester cyclase [Ardenticatenaceae bacterium]
MAQPPQSSPTQSDGSSTKVTLQNKGDLGQILSSNHLPDKPAMKGFDPKFRDLVDYIIKITHEIWEERAIGKLYEYYGTNMIIHTASGDIYGREKVIEASIQAMAAFPDRRLYGDEVIWHGNDEDGYFSSHRLTHEGTNWGHSVYGPPTGQRVSYRAIAECAIVEGVIVEEWLVRDELTLIHQLGLDVFETANVFAAVENELGLTFSVPSEKERLRGQLPPASLPPWDSAEFDVERFVRQGLHEIWNWRLLNKIRDVYASQIICDSASGRRFYGHNQVINYVLSLLSPFPDLALQVDHVCALQQDDHTYRTATRWYLSGTHTGPGVYGSPTGRPMHTMGVTHHLIENGKIIREWTLFDEFAVLKQLALPPGGEPNL